MEGREEKSLPSRSVKQTLASNSSVHQAVCFCIVVRARELQDCYVKMFNAKWKQLGEKKARATNETLLSMLSRKKEVRHSRE